MPCDKSHCNVWGDTRNVELVSGSEYVINISPGLICIISDCGFCVESVDPTLRVIDAATGEELEEGYTRHYCGPVRLRFEGEGTATIFVWAWCGPGHPVWCGYWVFTVRKSPQSQPAPSAPSVPSVPSAPQRPPTYAPPPGSAAPPIQMPCGGPSCAQPQPRQQPQPQPPVVYMPPPPQPPQASTMMPASRMLEYAAIIGVPVITALIVYLATRRSEEW